MALIARASLFDRVRTQCRHGKWVRGAVNYDQDLHFSTYYLRASCEGEFGYSTLVASYVGRNETYWLLEAECRDRAIAIVERSLRNPRWLPRLIREIERLSDALTTVFSARTSPESLARLSNEKLLGLYRRHDTRTRALYARARIPEALDRGVSYFTGVLKNHLRDKGVPSDEIDARFAMLTTPLVPSVLSQEICEFDAIVALARRSPVALPRAGGSAGLARMLLAPELLDRLEDHQSRWWFLPYHGYGAREIASLADYIERLLRQLDSPPPLGDAVDDASRDSAARDRDELLRELGVEPRYAALFRVYPEIGAVKLYRRSAQLRNFHFLDMLLAEIARRLRVSEWTIRCLTPEEVIECLESGSVAAVLRERTDGCVFVRSHGCEQVLSGERARDLSAILRASIEAPRDSEPGLLRGTVAQRGKVSGPVKIVIRADRAAELAPGTILASEATDPDLTGMLRQAAGVLTEQGGVTSHAAIICRELGVPTIIGIDGLLETVKDGDWVELDAERGIVRLLHERNAKVIAPRREGAEIELTPHSLIGSAARSGSRLRQGSPRQEKGGRAGTIGPKASNLELVRSLGFEVPDFVVVDYEQIKGAANQPNSEPCRLLAQETSVALGARRGDSLAVRSSAIVEDCDRGSAAGAFTSLLDVRSDDLEGALRDFIRRNDAGWQGVAYAGSVIVQRMVDADHAGVCLTRDARTGYGDAIIVELAGRSNVGITSGTTRPHRIVVDRRTGDILDEVGTCEGLAPGFVGRLVRQMLSLEMRFGKPLDIEWAAKAGAFYILQVRPIVDTTAVRA